MEMVDIVKIAEEKRRRKLLTTIIVVMAAILLFLFALAAFQQTTGNFTINMSYTDRVAGMSLSDTSSVDRDGLLTDPQGRLTGEKIDKLGDTTFCDLDQGYLDAFDSLYTISNRKITAKSTNEDVIKEYEADRNRISDLDEKNGSHNIRVGDNHIAFAYTFFIQNPKSFEQDYRMEFVILKKSKGIENALRVVLFEDTIAQGVSGNQRLRTFYALNRVEGDLTSLPEHQDYPHISDELGAASLEMCNADANFGPYDKKTEMNLSKDTVFLRYREGVKSKEIHKYTIVIYLEGYDPQCVDFIKGSAIKMQCNFVVTNSRDDNQN